MELTPLQWFAKIYVDCIMTVWYFKRNGNRIRSKDMIAMWSFHRWIKVIFEKIIKWRWSYKIKRLKLSNSRWSILLLGTPSLSVVFHTALQLSVVLRGAPGVIRSVSGMIRCSISAPSVIYCFVTPDPVVIVLLDARNFPVLMQECFR